MLLIYKENDTEFVTKTSYYLLPMIGINFKLFCDYGFIDAYLGDGLRSYPSKAMYLLFAPEYTEEFAEFCERVREHENFIDDYDVDDEHVMIVFKIPKKYHEDVELFKQGKFSKISKEYVKTSFKDFKDPRRKVFDRDKYLKLKVEEFLGVNLEDDAELEGIPLPEKEIFRYEDNGWGN